MDIQVENVEGIEYMSTLQDNSIDLVLTDPPYIISKETGMNTHIITLLKITKQVYM